MYCASTWQQCLREHHSLTSLPLYRVTVHKKKEDRKRKRQEDDKAKAEAKEAELKQSDDTDGKPVAKKAKAEGAETETKADCDTQATVVASASGPVAEAATEVGFLRCHWPCVWNRLPPVAHILKNQE